MMEATQAVVAGPVADRPATPVRVLTDQDVERLDAAACRILDRVGVAVPSAGAAAALRAAGARIDHDRATVPPDTIRELVRRAPAQLVLGARVGGHLLTGERSLLTTDGCCTEIYNPVDGTKRPTTAADVARVAALADALDDIDFCWPAVSAQDVPAGHRGLEELRLTLAGTGKHVQTVTVVEPRQAAVAVEMSRVLSGGEEAARRHPPISALLGTVTPLGNDGATLEAALVFAEAGVPIGFVTMPMGGSTTPLTMAGSLAVGLAEALSAVAIVQAAVPGAPVFICFIPSFMDLKTGDFTGGAPEDTLMASAVADIGRFYGLPTQCGINAAGAKHPGWQSAIDDVATTFLSMLTGVDMLTGVGMVAGGRIFSLEETVLAAALCGAARGFAGQGPIPTFDGDEEPAAWAGSRARSLLESHAPPALPDDVQTELRRLVETAGV